MGLTKQYLRYAPCGVFNIIASRDCNCVHTPLKGISGRYVAVGACEHVIIWDMRLGEKAQVLSGENIAVSQIAASPTGDHIAIGYVDGNINVFELTNNEIVCVFAGHKSAVTSLEYDEQGHRLVSGSKDTHVILWDIVSETGIAKFSGHKGVVTSVLFLNGNNCIVSASKDTFVKFWDIETKHCFKTLGGHQLEVWSAVLLKQESYLVTGTVDHQLRVWKLNWSKNLKEEDKLSKKLELVKIEESENTEESSVLQCHQVGSLIRGGKGRVVGLAVDPGQSVLACYGTDSLLELFSFCTDEDAKERMEKRIKKQRKKLAKMKEKGETESEFPEISEKLTLTDEVKRLTSVKLDAKLKSVSLLMGTSGELRVAVTSANNTVGLYSLKIGEENQVQCLKLISQLGHRKEPRCVAVSSDNLAILSVSADCIKIWNRVTQSCLRSIPLDSSLGAPHSACFAPGDRHALVACGSGALLLADVAAARVLETAPAHPPGPCAVVRLTPDMRGCYTGGGDKTVKLWQFELIDDPTGESKGKVLSVLHIRTLELEESVLDIKISPNSKFIAVALFDSTVKIFFLDSFKFYLSLYGHKLPVTCVDISYDSALIVTGSADRNLKVWGMDFGDCHKSIFAHNDTVTSVQFVEGTHYCFTSSKDGKVKQWDADTYDNIITLQGHFGECAGVRCGAGGLHAVSCGADRALRLYSRTDEPLVLGDTDDAEEGLATGEHHAPVPGMPGLNLPTKKTIGAEKAADSIMECLSVIAEWEQDGSRGPPPPLMAAFGCDNPTDFLIETIRRIRSSELEEAVLLLPFNAACSLIRAAGASVATSGEPCVRAALLAVRAHHAQLAHGSQNTKHLVRLQADTLMAVSQLRDTVGANVAALQWMRRELEQPEAIFREATTRAARASRRRRAVKRPLVTLT